MDQACECLANAGSALRIDFNPLVATPIQLPKRALFAVLHSGVEMNKAATTYYNQRVVECRIAAQVKFSIIPLLHIRFSVANI